MLRLSGNTAKWTRSASTPLDENGSLYGYGPATGDIDIAFIGPGPLAEDTYHGTFYAGQAGKFLSWGCASADIYRRRTWTTGLTTSPAPRNDFSHVNAAEAIKLEHNDFRNELQYLVTKRNLKVAVIWGDETLHTFGITSPISQVRGSVYVFNVRTWTEAANQTDNTLLLIPTYAPDYLMKNRWTKSGKGRADYAAVWIDDLTKARRLSVEGWNPPKENFNLSPTFDDVYAYVQAAKKRRSLIAVDIETTAFTPDKGEVVCVGLAHSGEDAIVVPFLSDGGKHYWPSDIGRNVRTLLGELFTSCPLMFQNALFDVPFLQGRGFVCPMTSVQHDTLLLHHAVSPELTHKLGFIVSQYGDTPYWKDEFQNRDTTITRMDQSVLRRYNARDCVVLHQVLPGLLDDLEEVGSADVYYNESIALLPAILQMMQTGVVFDHKARNALRRKLEREVSDLEQDLRTLGQLPENFNLSSDDDLRLLLYNDVSTKYAKGEDYESKRVGSKVRDQLYALYDVRHNTVPLYPPKGFRGRRTDSGKLTVNKQGRLSYQRYLQNRLARLQELKRPTDEHHDETLRINAALLWLARYQDYTELQKILSTYMDYPVGDDDRVHTKFIVHGTATGRLACVAGDTKLITDRGVVTVEEYDPSAGARVYTHWGTWEVVRRKIYKGIDRMQKITLSSGETLTATKDHRVLVRDGGWKSIGELTPGEEIVYVSEEKVVERQKNLSASGRGVSRSRKADYRIYIEDDRRNFSNGVGDPEAGIAVGSASGRAGLTVLPFEDGRAEPDEREDWRTTPQLDRGMLRRQRLLNNLGPWEAVLRSPGGDGRAAGHTGGESSCDDGSAPYRSRSAEQRSGELSIGDQFSSPKPAWSYATVVEKADVGTLRVWDLEVDNAHSYWAGGVFNHNSREPNLQNLPKKRSKDIRKMFIAPPEHVILAADYENLEVKVMAYETGDPELIDIVDNGKNMHDINTRILFNLTPDDPQWSAARAASKIFMFGSLAYGGGDNEIYEKVILDVPELQLTFREFVAAKERYMASHPVYTQWREKITEQVRRTRRIENAFGRVRTFYGNDRDIVKEALNFPIQSAAASIINRATVRIYHALESNGYRTRLQAQIHDELRLEVPLNELERIVPLVRTEMERPVKFRDTLRTFQTSMEYGPDWASLSDVTELEASDA